MSERTLKTPPKKRASSKRRYMKMLVEGRCVNCGAVDDFTRQGRSRCAVCNAKHHRPAKKAMTPEQRQTDNANKREWAQMRKAAHVCVDCGKQDKRTLDGKCQCLQCAKKRADRRRELRDPQHDKELRAARKAKWKAAGLCTTCGQPKEEADKAMCATCKVKFKLRKAKQKIKEGKLPRGANGKCYQCNRAPAIEGKRLCQACYDKKIETLRENAKNRWKKERADD